MKQFIELVKEINRTLNGLILFDVAVNAILIFLSIYLFLALFNLYPLLAILPTAVYFLMAASKRMGTSKMRTVESKYSELKEKLRTAADNLFLNNPVVNELQEEIMHGIKKVGISSFLSPKNLSYRIFVCVILAFTIVFVSTLNLNFLDLENLLKEAPGLLERQRGSPLGFSSVNLTEDIYGEKELAILGNEKINIKIQPSNFKVSVKEGGKVEEKKFDEMFPKEAFVETAEVFEENIPLEQQELVKTYFKKVSE